MTAKQFRKRPVVVSAIQWTGDNEGEVREFTGSTVFRSCTDETPHDPQVTAHVYDVLHKTWVGVKTGQWVIRGVAGEFYPIDESVLAETYEPVADA